MTFATKPRVAGRVTGVVRRGVRRRGFTLLELLVVVGILVLIAGILLPALNAARRSAVKTRTRADIALLTAMMDQYKKDWGGYPAVPAGSYNAGAAVLCKAMLGSYDAAHYYTGGNGSSAALAYSDDLQNPPPAYVATKTYDAGDVVLSGSAAPTYDAFIGGTQNTVFVCVRNGTQADGTARTPTGGVTDFYWARFFPYDGSDGPGGRLRLGAAIKTDANGNEQPHAPTGKVLGPYVNPGQFRTSENVGAGVALLDRYDSPILYFPVNRAADPRAASGLVGVYPGGTGPTTAFLQAVNPYDNFGPFLKEGVGETGAGAAVARIGITLGDYDQNGATNGDEPTLAGVPFLIWSAGPDRLFGPPGVARATPADCSKGDFVTNNSGVDQNRAVAVGLDDITNFRD